MESQQMAAGVLNYVVGDLTIGKPESKEFQEWETVEKAIAALAESSECGIPVWKPKNKGGLEDADTRHRRFVGILYSVDIVAFLAKTESLADNQTALATSVSAVVSPNSSLLQQVEPATRLIDALEMMKNGVRRLLVRKHGVWQGLTKRFSVLYNGKWMSNSETHVSSSNAEGFFCLSREDMIRFVIGCLGALAPLPLSSVSSLGMIEFDFDVINSSDSAMEAMQKVEEAIAVVEEGEDGRKRIIGEISANKLWKQDYLSVARELGGLSAGEFVRGVDDLEAAKAITHLSPRVKCEASGVPGNLRWASYTSRNAPLTCRVSSSLAAVMAQMLSHRASHVWVTEEDSGVLLGVVAYRNVFEAITSKPSGFLPAIRTSEILRSNED